MTTQRSDVPAAWDERTMLLTFLDYTRATARAKCEGLSEENARSAPLPGSPLMTISGLVSHLRWVDNYWIETVLLGRPDEAPWTEEDPDREYHFALDVPVAVLLDEYDAQAAEHRRLIAGLDLDTPAQKERKDGPPFTLRWILHHLIEETARHNGHLDILRELADGTTGS
ncbi:DinB family protein [Streptacidiphilus sp. EB129]|uniref:DinB family protein n=1 Tax=Streptacidiphilus sp. EB129 TaxID=3156262 RepID=UPI003513BF68